ncbi:type II secretion system minor pseudopilin GspJ [Aliidiomarina quisquiliarum]|uniref:type II secretion system minor pseudopilin GspJ n=1 Tax=Aliidiomarina quisquiliarum TaxID=2938947 RepID=UPI00208F0C3F|nr:type II secretion system minor pseudopilin GspJ [Aliidiomarina quisquiliarum]MCO4321580.1 type II secretion system minor pseudopilin GspJ [Aliidiomarina quisquiliarum]
MHKTRGFTLIEVMVAMVVLALIGLASAAVLSQMTQAEEASSKRHALLSELQFSLLIIDRDVRQMVARTIRATDEQAKHIYLTNEASTVDSDSGALVFVRGGWSNPEHMLPRSELQPVAYRVRERVLQRVYQPFVDSVSSEPTVQDLLSQVESFEVEFSGESGERVSRWLQPHQLPERVYIRIEHEQLGMIERVLLTSGGKPTP